MSEITDKFDEFMLHVSDHGADMKARDMYRHLRTLMTAQDRALAMVIQENTARAEEAERWRKDYFGACGLVAKMHEAAVGEITGPVRGVVEDVADVRAELVGLKSELDQTHMTVTLRGGIEVWGVEFVQWLEDRLDTLDGFERVGKSITDDYIHIHMQTKTAWYQAGKVTR